MEAIQRSIDEQGHLPTFREVADRLGVCLNNVTQMLYRLRRDGMVEWKDGKARTLRLTHGEHEQAEGQGG
jgi:Mn-dependent DtxR family transcriptional regulator